eukprot:Clim_evm7s241 gene=Clim_evmTU7s241
MLRALAFHGTRRRAALHTAPAMFATTARITGRSMSTGQVIIDSTAGALESLHTSLGLPWWAVIITTTVAVRSVVSLPLAVYNARMIERARIVNRWVQVQVESLKFTVAREAVKQKLSHSQYASRLKARAKSVRSAEYAKHDIALSRAFLLPAIQMPLWILLSFSLRSLSGTPMLFFEQGTPAAGLDMGGVLHATNLLEADPYMILPILTGVCHLINIESNVAKRAARDLASSADNDKPLPQKTSNEAEASPVEPADRFQDALTGVMRFVALAIIPLGSYLPACITLYWASSAAFSVGQNLALNSSPGKERLRIGEYASDMRGLTNPAQRRVPGYGTILLDSLYGPGGKAGFMAPDPSLAPLRLPENVRQRLKKLHTKPRKTADEAPQ